MPDDPLDRPVTIDNHGRTLLVLVRPSDVLAALDDEQREALTAQNALRDERVRADERERIAREVRSYVTDGKLIGSRAAVVVAYVERAIREGGQR